MRAINGTLRSPRSEFVGCALGVSCIVVAETTSAQSPAPGTAEEYRQAAIEKLRKLDRLKKSKGLNFFAKSANELEKQVEQLKANAELAAERVPPKVPLPPRTSRVTVPPVVLEQDDGLERLRRNQRALTDQRIGDILILRTD